jgi:hypothetical protein
MSCQLSVSRFLGIKTRRSLRKAKVGHETEQSDDPDSRKDSLGVKRLLSFKNHVADANCRSDHLSRNDDDERNSPGKPYTRKNVRQAARQHDAGKGFARCGTQGLGGAKEMAFDNSPSSASLRRSASALLGGGKINALATPMRLASSHQKQHERRYEEEEHGLLKHHHSFTVRAAREE